MQSTSVATKPTLAARTPGESTPAGRGQSWKAFPGLPLAFACVLAAFALFPPVRNHPRLIQAFVGAAALLIGWIAVLWVAARRNGRVLAVELAPPVKSHYVQASVQSSIYIYWGWYWPKVYAAAPLILGQMVFLYLLEALIAWSRGRKWRLGFGPLPIVLSTNFFLWFKDDWFAFQFAMIAVSAFAKEFIRWNRDGKQTHIFNPSAFGLSLASVILIATGTTQYTYGIEVATTLGRPPHIYLWIFAVGLVVQYFFSVTLMTLSAVATLYVMNVVYTASTGVYFFVDTTVPIAVFLGMHLLVTDPATSPRTSSGRVLFGVLYGIGNWVLFAVLGNLGVPDFYDKLLPVPILNLSVRLIDRLTRAEWWSRLAPWTLSLAPRRANLVHMSCWIAVFATMLSTGAVDAPHPGASIAFWRNAYEEGKPHAGRNWMKMVGANADSGNPAACNQLGAIYLDGVITPQNRRAAAHYFARASAMGHLGGSENVVAQFLEFGEADSKEAVERAFDQLGRDRLQSKDGRADFLLGYANEIGRGRVRDASRALTLYRQSCARGNLDASKALLRLARAGNATAEDVGLVASVLSQSCEAGNSQSCLELARIHQAGIGVQADEEQAVALLRKACELGSPEACAALNRPGTPSR